MKRLGYVAAGLGLLLLVLAFIFGDGSSEEGLMPTVMVLFGFPLAAAGGWIVWSLGSDAPKPVVQTIGLVKRNIPAQVKVAPVVVPEPQTSLTPTEIVDNIPITEVTKLYQTYINSRFVPQPGQSDGGVINFDTMNQQQLFDHLVTQLAKYPITAVLYFQKVLGWKASLDQNAVKLTLETLGRQDETNLRCVMRVADRLAEMYPIDHE